MTDSGYIKEIIIKENDNNYHQKIENMFPILIGKEWTLRHTSTRGSTMEYALSVGQQITYALIKR
jgi:hypothetical protein